jgi:predicted aminopeptidase
MIAGALAGCSPTYVIRAGWEEAKILSSRRSIHEVVHDTATASVVRAKLRLVQDAREFARNDLGLDPGDSFTSYAALDRDTLLLVVSAAPEFHLSWKTWWFPIVGKVPYRGYFDFEKALREAEKLGEKGYDTWVRPTAAFSTLGWLPDPVLSTTLGADSVGLVETVIHEITHTTFFPKGEAQFNESFANFVGHRGAIAFFCEAMRDEPRCEAARDRWHDVRVFGRFFKSIVEPLRELYAMDLPSDSMRDGKSRVLREAAARFEEDVQTEFRSGRYAGLDPERLNNAWLLSRVLYYNRLDDLEAVYRSFGDLEAAIAAILDEARGRPPWEAVDLLLDSSRDAAGGAVAPPVR